MTHDEKRLEFGPNQTSLMGPSEEALVRHGRAKRLRALGPVLCIGAVVATVFLPNAQGQQRCIVDVGLVATNQGGAPKPLFERQIGYWDVDGSGGVGTRGDRGGYMMGLSVKYGTTGCLEDVRVIASSASGPPPAPDGYLLVGHWDVDNSGGFGADDRSTGAYMMGLYKKPAPAGASGGRVLTDLHLTASSSGSAAPAKGGYELVGYWDVDNSGGRGTDNSSGNFMMTLQRQRIVRAPEALPIGRPKGSWVLASSGGQKVDLSISRSLSIGALSEKALTRETRANLSTTITNGMDFLVGSVEVAVTAGLETASSSASRIAKERKREFTEQCTQSLDLEKFNIHAVWQWRVVVPVAGEEVEIKTCDITCTQDGKPPTYLPGAVESRGACFPKPESKAESKAESKKEPTRLTSNRHSEQLYHWCSDMDHTHEYDYEYFYLEEIDEEFFESEDFFDEDFDNDRSR